MDRPTQPERPNTRLTIQIDMLPRISEILSELFQQLQCAGLLVARFGSAPQKPTDSFLERFGRRPALLLSIATAVESCMPGGVAVSDTPVVMNHARWSDPRMLGGYAGHDLSVKPSELLASYVGCWQHAGKFPDTAFSRFLRLGLWYWRERNDIFAALGLLIDLYQAGFCVSQMGFLTAANVLCDAYTQQFEIGSLADLDFASEKADRALNRALRGIARRPHADDRAHALVSWLEDRAIDGGERTRKAPTADSWVLEQARLQITAELLRGLDRKHRAALGATQRAIASMFEEIRADLGGDVIRIHMEASQGLPLLVDLVGLRVVGLAYQQVYGPGWLTRLLDDRILAPDALRKTVAEAYAGAGLPAIPDFELPAEWRMVSELTAWPLCVAFDREPALQRSRDFEGATVVAACRELRHKPKRGETGVIPEDFEAAHQAEARRELSLGELARQLGDERLFSADAGPEALAKLTEIAQLYPWNHAVRLELGIRHDESGDVAEGYRQLRAALLLEPTSHMNWQSMSVVLNRMGEQPDALFAAAIAQTIEKEKQE